VAERTRGYEFLCIVIKIKVVLSYAKEKETVMSDRQE
jgi:hypothetical protein